ncbi:MAG: hypothetical protein ACREIA_00915 [Opitutaceae bacterium]
MGIYVMQEMQEEKAAEQWSFIVYEKLHPALGKVYTGRTRGIGTPPAVLARRDAGHVALTEAGYYAAIPNAVITTQGWSNFGHAATRGREQQVMDYHGGSLTDRDPVTGLGYFGRVRAANIRRGVGKLNLDGFTFWKTSNFAYNELVYFTGSPSLQIGGPVIPDAPFVALPVSVNPYFWPN